MFDWALGDTCPNRLTLEAISVTRLPKNPRMMAECGGSGEGALSLYTQSGGKVDTWLDSGGRVWGCVGRI